MKKILFLIIYLVGCFFGYQYCKYNLKNSFHGEWTKGDRAFAIVFSSGSWFSVVAMGIVDGVKCFNNDEPANW